MASMKAGNPSRASLPLRQLEPIDPLTPLLLRTNMSRPQSKSIIVISGLGNGVGVGAEVGRLFSRELGYRIALVSRPRQDVEDLAASINEEGGEVSCRPCSAEPGGPCGEADSSLPVQAVVFSLQEYTHSEIKAVFNRVKQRWSDGRVKTAVWNTGQCELCRSSAPR